MTSQNLTLALAELHARMVSTGTISDSHRRVLSQALGSPNLEESERLAIDRLLWGGHQDRCPYPHP
ncbi:MAG: hypothetical protein F6K00_06265 [Leptolyngbya sp. SIOISBB]|nr:hypothetical protein [Leptolyngbya sp. SIOISBB]